MVDSLVWYLRNSYTFVVLKLARREARRRERSACDTRPAEQPRPRPISGLRQRQPRRRLRRERIAGGAACFQSFQPAIDECQSFVHRQALVEWGILPEID